MLTKEQQDAIFWDEIENFNQIAHIFEDDYYSIDIDVEYDTGYREETWESRISEDEIHESFIALLDDWYVAGYLDSDLSTATSADLENAISYRRFLDRTFTLLANNWMEDIVPNDKCITYTEFLTSYVEDNGSKRDYPDPDFDD